MVIIVEVISAFVMLLLIFCFFFANGARIYETFRSLNQVARKYGKAGAGRAAGIN
jgi:hypothetical protein